MSDWQALAKARKLGIPEDAVARIAPSLDALEAAFTPLLAKLPHTTEPAIIVSEAAIFGLPASAGFPSSAK